MNTELLDLRLNAYRAAACHYRIVEKWFIALLHQRTAEEMAHILWEYDESAQKYGDALDELMARLTALKLLKPIEEELNRTHGLKELLKREQQCLLV